MIIIDMARVIFTYLNSVPLYVCTSHCDPSQRLHIRSLVKVTIAPPKSHYSGSIISRFISCQGARSFSKWSNKLSDHLSCHTIHLIIVTTSICMRLILLYIHTYTCGENLSSSFRHYLYLQYFYIIISISKVKGNICTLVYIVDLGALLIYDTIAAL